MVQQPGWGMTAKSEESGCGITSYADSKNFISVTVQGDGDNTHSGGPWYSWNAAGTTLSPGPEGNTCTSAANFPSYCYTSCKSAGKCPSPQCSWTTCHDTGPTPSGTGTDLSGFIPSLYDTLESQLCLDVTREYNSGESNGGIMCYQNGVVMHSRLAAIAPQFGSFQKGFRMAPSTGVPLLTFHGSKDTTVPANVSLSGDGYYYTTTKNIIADWKTSNGCSGGMTVYKDTYSGTDKLWCEGFQSCSSGDVIRCSWNGGHNWFGNKASLNGGLVTTWLLKWTKPSHIGMGATTGQVVPQGNILNITILTEAEEEAMDKAAREATLNVDVQMSNITHNGKAYYGNPKNGCRPDEDAIEAGTGRVCAPKVKSIAGADRTCNVDADCDGQSYCMNGKSKVKPYSCHGIQPPKPACTVGALNNKKTTCPTSARVRWFSKAWPVCLGKGVNAQPYLHNDFHCLLTCPCLGDGKDKCGAASDAHCPRGAVCERGELRHMAHGVCTYH